MKLLQFKVYKKTLMLIKRLILEKCVINYNPKSEKVGTVWKTQIKKESSDF